MSEKYNINLLQNNFVPIDLSSNNQQNTIQLPQSQYHYQFQYQIQTQAKSQPEQIISTQTQIIPGYNQQVPSQPQLYYHPQNSNNYPVLTIQHFEVSSPFNQFLKDLDTRNQFFQVRQALSMLATYQVLLINTLFFLLYFEKSVDESSPKALLFFVPLYCFTLFLVNFRTFKKKPFSIILYLVNILLAALVMFFICTFFSNKRPPKQDGLYFTDFAVAIISSLLLLAFNFGGIMLILIYLCYEKNKVKLEIILPILYFACLLLYLVWDKFLPLLLISFYYNFCLLICIKQSLAGRFSLKYNEILNTANAYNYGIIFPFYIGKY